MSDPVLLKTSTEFYIINPFDLYILLIYYTIEMLKDQLNQKFKLMVVVLSLILYSIMSHHMKAL